MAIKVVRRSNLDGKIYSMELDITQEQLDRYERREDLVQNIFPDLRPDQREFIISGITPVEWENVFGNDKDDQFDEERSYE